MPIFFFDIFDGMSVPDVGGTYFQDIERAKEHAVDEAANMIRNSGPAFNQAKEWRLSVRDENGDVRFELQFSAHDHAVTKATSNWS